MNNIIMENDSSNDFQSLFESIIKEESMFSKNDIDKLIKSIENDKNNYLENKTMTMIQDNIYNSLDAIEITETDKNKIINKLHGYRHVDDLRELWKGKHVRWIQNKKKTLTNGGILMNIKFTDTGTHIICRNNMNRFFQISFDDCILFQKMSLEEQMILMAYENIKPT